MTRVRSVIALVLLLVVVGLLAGLSLADPFHLRHARWFTAGLVGSGLLLLVAALAVATPRGVLRGTVLLLGVVALVGWAGFVFATTRLTGTEKDLTVAPGSSGRRLVVEADAGMTVEPVYAVVLRSGGGPFEQESVVYQGVEGSPQPVATRFVEGDTVEVQTVGGCRYRSAVEAVTLAVDPVHRPLQPRSC